MPADQETITDYRHEATRKNIPPAALAAQGRVREAPRQRYYYDPHLPPALRFDGTGESDRLPELLENATRRKLTGEEARTLADALRNHEPWLEWAGKREKKYFEVDPVALHVHERVSAQAAVRIAARQDVQRSLWADPEQEYHEAVQFYQHDVDWANRLVLGDSLLVMSSLAKREDLAGKVQMIYVDPPYGISFPSNFQPLVRNRNVTDRDTDLTREPEMVKAYRDTWTLGVHTYLAYLRDRLMVARDLLTDSGSIFMQIGDENVHRVRAVMDQVFGEENFVVIIAVQKTGSQTGAYLQSNVDYILWYRKSESMKFHPLFLPREIDGRGGHGYTHYQTALGMNIPIDEAENAIASGELSLDRIWRSYPLTSKGFRDTTTVEFRFDGKVFHPGQSRHWGVTVRGLERAGKAGRLATRGAQVHLKRFFGDSTVVPLGAYWTDVGGASDAIYVVQTNARAIERCILMTTDAGDLVLDPTCGSGTTAYVAEQWGRRWITIDTSRVAVALARQRILTAKFDYYKTEDDSDNIGESGFKYKTAPHVTLGGIAQNVALDPIFARWEPILDEKLDALNTALSEVDDDTRAGLLAKLNAKRMKRGRKDGVTDADERRWNLPKDRWEHWEVPFDADPDYPPALRDALQAYRKAWRQKMDEVNACIAANADQEVLVDQPEVEPGIVRVSGPFTVEAVHPPEQSLEVESPIGGAPGDLDTFEEDGAFNTDDPSNAEAFVDTMIRLLRNDGVRFQGNGVARFTRLEPLTDGNVLHAEGEWDSGDPEHLVAVSIGPQRGPVTAMQVEESLRAASRRGYDALVFAGFSFDGAAQLAIQSDPNPHVRVHMAHIAPDVTMGDLLKETRDSQLFSVSGSPRTKLTERPDGQYVIEMEGVDIYDPVKNTIESASANSVAAWFLDSDYDGRTFSISQAFFPDSNAWDKLKRALKSLVDAEAFEAFSGTESLPFPRGKHARAAVKVIDPRGNEVMKVHSLGNETYLTNASTHDAHAARSQDEFARLAAEWRMDRPRGVDVAQMTKHPAYARIIKMGPTAIPLILEELDREVDHWFPALHALTGVDPVPESGMGNLSAMAEAWLDWGRREGYIH